MALYQNSTVNDEKLILGNYKIEVAATALATYTNIGAGILTSFSHEPTMYDAQAGNAPDPIEGVATEVCKLDFEMIEYDSSVLSVIHGGLITSTTISSVQTINAGGNSDPTITPKAYRCTNTRMQGTTTVENIIIVYRATPDTGPKFSLKSDNDTDPIAVMPLSVTGKLDTGRSAGDQLYSITYDVYEG